ncbi:RES family NAD+ phosphorylase [Alteromonas sp. CYL-A6]|uniref:RES family NAD+ phosphorylase n=1 Tax=Alteromonas nitratireducens TaxID=3390813 RepID=UPI0034AD909C
MTPEACLAKAGGFCSYDNDVFRIVETQERAATLTLVDDLNEQSLLEDIIDGYKPPNRDGYDSYHYLIATPFRYPPLKEGSRFGTRAEHSFYYASEDVETCLAEAAYYRFVLFDGMETPYQDKVVSEHQYFSVRAQTTNAVDLARITDKDMQSILTSKLDYNATQKVGAWLRNQGAELIRFQSARTKQGVNVAIDNIDVIVSPAPENMTNVLCETHAVEGTVRFSIPQRFPILFRIEDFLVNGALPSPA